MRVSICMCGRAPERLGTLEKRYVIYPKLLPPFPYHKDPENVSVETLTFEEPKRNQRIISNPHLLHVAVWGPACEMMSLAASPARDPVFYTKFWIRWKVDGGTFTEIKVGGRE